MASWRPGAKFQEKYLARGAPISELIISLLLFCTIYDFNYDFLQTNLLSYYLVSPDVRNSDLEAGFPVQLFYFNQTLRYPEIAVAL